MEGLRQSASERESTRSPDRSHEGPLRLGTTVEEEGRLSRRAVEGLEELLPRAVSPSFAAGDVLLCAHSARPAPLDLSSL